MRVVAPDVGGGFGPKINPSPEDVLVADANTGWTSADAAGLPILTDLVSPSQQRQIESGLSDIEALVEYLGEE